MNKKYYFLIGIGLILILSIFIGYNKGNNITKEFINTFNLDINSKDLKVSTIYNSYGGFPYEGQALYKFESMENIKLEDTNWTELPLRDELLKFLYKDNGQLSIAKQINLPEVEKGKWYFIDRGNTDFINPYAYNFSLCIYDEVNNIFYYYKIDT